MLKWIRWSGIAGFLVVMALIASFWLFAAGPLVKMTIEYFGSRTAEAEVNVEDVSFAFNPLAIEITGVQVADKDAPMTNLFSFDKAVATIEPLPLLVGKAVIPELVLDGVATGTERSRSGALIEKSTESQQQAKTSQESDDNTEDKAFTYDPTTKDKLPSVDEIVTRENLLTEQRGKALEQAVKDHEMAINQAEDNLPTEDSLKDYEQRLDQILSGRFKSVEDFKQRKRQFEDLKQQFKQDKQAIRNAKQTIETAKSDLKQKWSALKRAPKEDINNIKNKYTLDAQGTANLTALLFGDDMGGYAATALKYYEMARPYLVNEELKATKTEAKAARLEGRFVHFETDRPVPDFWIKQTRFSVKLPEATDKSGQLRSMGNVKVRIQDITHQPDVINKPMTLLATGTDLTTMDALTLKGRFDHRRAVNDGRGEDKLNLTIENWRLYEMKLGLAGLSIEETNTQVSANAVLVGRDLNAQGVMTFSKSAFSSSDRTVLAKEMLAALRTIDQFNLEASAKGEFNDPDLRIASDLDRQLENAFDERIDQKQAEFEQKLKDKLNEKLLSYSGDYQAQLKDLNLAEGRLSDKQEALENLAKAEISSYQDQLKAEAKAKAEKEKAKAKAEADRKKKELEEKAKKALKDLF
ncbi:TIGR03545 family protein [Bermanella marisrubri]|uniref:TIGR03545 family protein n=1 Tax=Bermanella marisrubri TaxID=207949 RepID=Q1MZX8_9GAMM|nr:TIGR03545 family protein [Bermanella marisrubri]EAT11585.1 hypothetical protein RED65_02904 [Oceanobacter sp. RED65] [Bermanella marisrubri]QIZ84953.1 TIGR03545 family protein [Bermanella marisrubri]